MEQVIRPTVQGMLDEGRRYRGFLYLESVCDGIPKVLEYNCRFGDPETQPIMMRMQSDLAPLLLAAINGDWRANARSGTRVLRWESYWRHPAILGIIPKAR